MSEVPSFDELLQLINGLLERASCDSMQVFLVSKATGVAQFVQVADNPTFQSELHQALLSSAIPLDMLSWQRNEGGLGASKFIFPWVEEDEVASNVVSVSDKAMCTVRILHLCSLLHNLSRFLV
jgi:hypothetical protein